MRTNIYSIYDTVAKIFNKPFMEHNDETAKRSFKQTAQDQPLINDYTLYHLGYYDDNTGAIIPVDPLKIYSGLECSTPTVSSITPEMQRVDLEKTA